MFTSFISPNCTELKKKPAKIIINYCFFIRINKANKVPKKELHNDVNGIQKRKLTWL